MKKGVSRRGQKLLLLAGCLLTVAAAALLMVRSRAKPYVPGDAAKEDDEEITRSLDRDLPASAPKVVFRDVAAEVGVRFLHFRGGKRSTQLPEDMGSGVAFGDFDGDGDPDLFLAGEAGPLDDSLEAPSGSALFANRGDGTFRDVTSEAGLQVKGLCYGAAFGDFDGDLDLDLLITRYGSPLLLVNDGKGTFTDRSREAGIGEQSGFYAGVTTADYDRDGRLDFYICGYVAYSSSEEGSLQSSQYGAVVPSTLNPSSYEPIPNLLFHNQGDLRFRETAKEEGVSDPSGRSLSAAFTDLDFDRFPDLYVANDISDNALFWNRGKDQGFLDISHSAWVADYRGAMGLAVGDRDGDRDLDIFVSHWIAQENALYTNQAGSIAAKEGEPLHFTDEADLLGLGQIALDYIGWGTGFFDFDNDGRLDLFVVNGSTFQEKERPGRLVPMRNLLFWNGGVEDGFYEMGKAAGEAFQKTNVGRGAAAADIDGDGDLDLAINVNGGKARLLRNAGGERNNWLRVVLRGRGGEGAYRTTTFAVGARVLVTTEAGVFVRQLGASPSYLSQAPPGEVHFGLGPSQRVKELAVHWPDGSDQRYQDLPVRATVRLEEGGEPRVERAPGE